MLRKNTYARCRKKRKLFFIDLKFQSNNLCENVHDVSWENKTSVEDDEIFDISESFKEDQPTFDLHIKSNSTKEVMQQNQVEEAEMIEMVLFIHIEDKKVVLEEDLIENVKLVGERIERQCGKGKIYLIIIHSWKLSLP